MSAKAKSKKDQRDPRRADIRRILDLLESAYRRVELNANDRTFDTMVEKVINALHGGTATLEGASRTIAMLAGRASLDELNESVAAAEAIHRETCVCCRTTRAA